MLLTEIEFLRQNGVCPFLSSSFYGKLYDQSREGYDKLAVYWYSNRLVFSIPPNVTIRMNLQIVMQQALERMLGDPCYIERKSK